MPLDRDDAIRITSELQMLNLETVGVTFEEYGTDLWQVNVDLYLSKSEWNPRRDWHADIDENVLTDISASFRIPEQILAYAIERGLTIEGEFIEDARSPMGEQKRLRLILAESGTISAAIEKARDVIRPE